MTSNDVFYENITKNPRMKPFDLAMIHIFADREEKPYLLTNRGRLMYYQEFRAVDKDGNTLQAVFAFNSQKAREELERKFNKSTNKYQKWKEHNFAIRYLPYEHGKRTYALALLNKDENIEDAKKYMDDVCEGYFNFFSNKKR